MNGASRPPCLYLMPTLIKAWGARPRRGLEDDAIVESCLSIRRGHDVVETLHLQKMLPKERGKTRAGILPAPAEN